MLGGDAFALVFGQTLIKWSNRQRTLGEGKARAPSSSQRSHSQWDELALQIVNGLFDAAVCLEDLIEVGHFQKTLHGRLDIGKD